MYTASDYPYEGRINIPPPRKDIYCLNDRISYKTHHAMVLIGCGEQDRPYWLCQNSYGKNYGKKGFGRILMDDYENPIIAFALHLPDINLVPNSEFDLLIDFSKSFLMHFGNCMVTWEN
ncbi:uncharacterized protein LOC133816806 [Humulus lupulus]|uniref:uncharacterized protein LOC133816806 n=1 Tax=Humulus lupulus TaxID=3486 RepID=UPI002B4062DC|nr:uncharacterized protein LOC133816806 [Humulus lupulus]